MAGSAVAVPSWPADRVSVVSAVVMSFAAVSDSADTARASVVTVLSAVAGSSSPIWRASCCSSDSLTGEASTCTWAPWRT